MAAWRPAAYLSYWLRPRTEGRVRSQILLREGATQAAPWPYLQARLAQFVLKRAAEAGRLGRRRAASGSGIRAKRLCGAAAGRRYGPPVARLLPPSVVPPSWPVRSIQTIARTRRGASETLYCSRVTRPTTNRKQRNAKNQRASKTKGQCEGRLRKLAQESERVHWPPPAAEAARRGLLELPREYLAPVPDLAAVTKSTGSPTSTKLKSSSTSRLRIRMQPCDAAFPMESGILVP